jgi:hypothetical protein
MSSHFVDSACFETRRKEDPACFAAKYSSGARTVHCHFAQKPGNVGSAG